MELNGLIAAVVTLGTIGHVLFLCQKKTQTLHSHSCVDTMDAESNFFKRYTHHPPTSQPRHQVRHLNKLIFFQFKHHHGEAKTRQTEGKEVQGSTQD